MYFLHELESNTSAKISLNIVRVLHGASIYLSVLEGVTSGLPQRNLNVISALLCLHHVLSSKEIVDVSCKSPVFAKPTDCSISWG